MYRYNNNIWHLHSLSIDESQGNVNKDIHYKTQTWTSCEKCKVFRVGIEPAFSGLLDH